MITLVRGDCKGPTGIAALTTLIRYSTVRKLVYREQGLEIIRGTLGSGAQYAISVPPRLNGTLLVWSPGYLAGPSGGEPSLPSGELGAWLADRGYVVASSKPTTNGWVVADLLRDQPEIPQVAQRLLGDIRTTIAWGNSMGGLTATVLVERHPRLFDAGLAMCASVAGGITMLNLCLDASFVFKVLLSPDDDALELVDVTDEAGRQQAAARVLGEAEATPAGRARLALAAAVGQVSTWSAVGTPQPSPMDWRQSVHQQAAGFLFGVFSPRQPLERRAGGNFSWNTGIDYGVQLRRSGDLAIVRQAYRAAGLDLSADLRALAAAPRISADPSAVRYMHHNAEPTGRLVRPLLTVHEIGDNAPVVAQARAYAESSRRTGSSAMLAQAFIGRPGHCGYTPAEVAAALTMLDNRITSGTWPSGATAAALNRQAAELARETTYDLGTSGYVSYQPRALIRRDDRLKTDGRTLRDGTPWSYAIPPDWDGRLVMHAGAAEAGQTVPQQWLLENGVAVAGYALSSSWNLSADCDHATSTWEAFTAVAGQPASTILTGRSHGAALGRVAAEDRWQGMPEGSLSERYTTYAPAMALAIGVPFRAAFEQTVGGAFSWNTGVDYADLLHDSGRIAEVRDAYQQAGGDFLADLATLSRAPRLRADQDVVRTVELQATFRGDLAVPVLDLHTTGDAAGPTMDEVAYADTVHSSGAAGMLRQAIVQATGHCTFQPIEEITALAAVLARVRQPAWTIADDPRGYARLAADLAGSTRLEIGTGRFVSLVPVTVTRFWDYRNWRSYRG